MLLSEIKQKIRQIVDEFGSDIVEESINLINGVLQVKLLVDFPQGGIDIKTCSRINRKISDWLESTPVADYLVEVSSPGLDRKLKSYDDFRRVRGQNLEVLLLDKVLGKGQWRGRLVEVERDFIVLEVPRGKAVLRLNLPYEKIQQGRILL